MKNIITIAVLAMLCTSAFSVNKCRDKKGNVFYQDAACEGSEKVNLSGAGQADLTSDSALSAKLDVLRVKRSELVNLNIQSGKVAVGILNSTLPPEFFTTR
jgi:hypothetical protein